MPLTPTPTAHWGQTGVNQGSNYTESKDTAEHSSPESTVHMLPPAISARTHSEPVGLGQNENGWSIFQKLFNVSRGDHRTLTQAWGLLKPKALCAFTAHHPCSCLARSPSPCLTFNNLLNNVSALHLLPSETSYTSTHPKMFLSRHGSITSLFKPFHKSPTGVSMQITQRNFKARPWLASDWLAMSISFHFLLHMSCRFSVSNAMSCRYHRFHLQTARGSR